jgi:hypothetical protein
MSNAYQHDFYAWTQAQGERLRRRSTDLDWDNIAEEVRRWGAAIDSKSGPGRKSC